MNETRFEVWVKSRPLAVQERGADGTTLCWVEKDCAIARANQLHGLYPNVGFVVRAVNADGASIVHDTTQTP